MALEKFNQQIQDIGKMVGLDDLKADEDGYVCLEFDEKIVTHIQYNDELDVLMLFCPLGHVREGSEGDLYPKLLQANLFWQGTGGGTIGVDDESREILLAYQVPYVAVEGDMLKDVIEGFVNTAEVWEQTLKAFISAPSEQEA